MTWAPECLKVKKWDEFTEYGYIQPKLDGIRLRVFLDYDRRVYAFGRDSREHLEYFGRYPFLKILLMDTYTSMPKMSYVDGELYSPGNLASSVTTFLANNEQSKLRYKVFSVPYWDSKDLAHENPLEIYEDFRDKFPFVETRQSYPNDFKIEVLNERIARIRIEGYVFKNLNYLQWAKYKPIKTVDCVITGIVQGKGKYTGLVGAIKVSVYNSNNELQEIASTSGMTDSVRLDITEDENLIGKICEVGYQYVGSGGRLRHPRFLRLRDDKPINQCTKDQLG